VGIFLVDDAGENAVLNAGTGDPGRQMLAANHKLQVGGTSMIGWATANRKARIALDVGKEAVRFENPLLPLTHSELAIPIISRAKAVGAISLQSQEVNAFTEDDILIFQGIADALAVALENASLFQQTQRNLEDIRKLNRAYVQTSWAERLERSGGLSYAFSNPDVDAKKGDFEKLTVPITLRDQVLGNISLEVDPKSLTDAEKELIDSISVQIALALENARLLETTQSRAAFERRLNTMAAEFSQKTRVEEILKSISKELSTLPTVNSVSIHLNPVTPKVAEQPKVAEKKGEKDDDAIQF
jgi:GAF domain-containing protein